MTLSTAHAYNPEATKKLQEMVTNVKDVDELVKQPRIKEIEQLIKEGADPGVKRKMGFLGEGDLIDLIVLLWGKNNDAAALENLVKLILEKGAQFTIDPENPISLALLVQNCPTSVIKMVINAGTDKQQIDKNMDSAIKILQTMIKESDESVKELQTSIQENIKKAQEDVVRYQKLIDDLKKPSTQNATPKASNSVKEDNPQNKRPVPGRDPHTRGPQNSPK